MSTIAGSVEFLNSVQIDDVVLLQSTLEVQGAVHFDSTSQLDGNVTCGANLDTTAGDIQANTCTMGGILTLNGSNFQSNSPTNTFVGDISAANIGSSGLMSCNGALSANSTANVSGLLTAVSGVACGDAITNTNNSCQVIDANGHICTTGSTPSIYLGPAAGTGATFSITGTDNSHTVSVITGSSPAANDTIFVVSYSTPFLGISGSAPRSTATPTCAIAAMGGNYVNNQISSQYAFNSTTALIAGHTYSWNILTQ